MMISHNDKNRQRTDTTRSIMHWLWSMFSSVRLAVTLILVITGFSLLGALLIQVPSEMSKNPQLYSYWIDTVARSKVGGWASLLSALHLFDVFHSPWFLIAYILLIFNIFICTINRWSSISLSLRGGTIRQRENFYISGNTNAELSNIQVTIDEAAMISEKVLRRRGYRIRTENVENNIYIAADKNRYYRLGTYFSHFSLILFVLAFIAGSYFGFRDTIFTVPVGSIREIGHGTTLSLQLISFVDEYYDNGMPKDYRSEVILYENSKPVKQALIRVNHPLLYKGIRFYQAYFGPSVEMLVRDENEHEIFNSNVPLDGFFNNQGYQYYEGFFDLPEEGLSVRLINSAVKTPNPMIPEGQVAVDVRKDNDQIDLGLVKLGTPGMVGGLEFTFLEESKYSGFQISYDPMSILIWIASTLFIIGIFAVLFFPYRQVWVLAKSISRGNSCLLIRMLAQRSFNSTSELNILTNEIEKELLIYPIREMRGK